MIFANLFDGSDNWKQARLPAIYSKDLMDVLKLMARQKVTMSQCKIYSSQIWDETNAQKDGTIRRNIHFPETLRDTNLFWSAYWCWQTRYLRHLAQHVY